MTATSTSTRSTPPATPVVPELPADLTAGLRRLKLSTIRGIAAAVMLTAKTQRWTPEELLRTLIEAELAARDASNTANRLKAAAFPVTKILDTFDVEGSSIPAKTFSYLADLQWITDKSNLALIGPPGTGKSHTLIALGHAAVTAGLKVKYCTAADLIEQLYRGLADNSVGRIIDGLIRNDLIIIDEVGFAPLDDTGTQLLFRLVAAAYERRSLAIASHWPFDQWGHFLPEHTTAVSILDRLLHHATIVVTHGESRRMKDARNHREATTNT
jgi:DNA replication protein DnaC